MPKDPKLCRTKYCRKPAKDGGLCHPCRYKKKKEVNLIRVVYQTLKGNAMRRGKAFEISIVEFSKFCKQTKYIAGRGRSVDSLSIDRIDNSKGYTIDNIRVLSLSKNSEKGQVEKKILSYDYVFDRAEVYTLTVEDQNAETPF